MRKLLSLFLAVAVLFGLADQSFSQTASKPVVTVSFAGMDKLTTDIGMIGKLAGNPNMGKQVELMSAMMLQAKDGKGSIIDAKKPWGIVLTIENGAPNIFGFIPANDLDALVTLVQAQLGQEVESENGVYKIPAGEQTAYAVQKGDWALIGNSLDKLDKAAADPATLLGDLPKKYNLAIRASIANLPKEYREQLLAQLRAGAEVGMQQMPGESVEEHAVRTGMAKQAVQQLNTLAAELDEVLLGWNIDAKTKTTYLDLELKATKGTTLAKQFAEVQPGKSDMAALILPGATVTASTVGILNDLEVAQAKSNLASLRKTAAAELSKQGLSDDELNRVSPLLNELIDVLEKTVETKKTDAAMSLMLDPAALTIVGGAKIADGDKLQKTIQKLVAEVKKNDEAAEALKFSDETYKGILLNVLKTPVADPEMAALVGDELEIVVAATPDKVLAAAGRDAAETLKKAIDSLESASGKEVPPMQIAVSMKSLAAFLAEVGEDEQTKATAAMMAGILERAGDKDHLTVVTGPIPQGIRIRMELEEGLLTTIGSMGQLLLVPGGGMPGGGF